MNILDRIEKHLLYSPETTISGKIKNIICGAAIYLAWGFMITELMRIYLPEIMNQFIFSLPPPTPSTLNKFLSLCIFAPLVEEVYFRLTPYEILKHIPIKRVMLLGVLLSSLIFGSLHIYGRFSIPIQGVAGLIFSYVYIKNGYSYWSSVATHFLVNFTLFLFIIK